MTGHESHWANRGEVRQESKGDVPEGAGHLEHDLGAPPHYGNATVLLSEGVENFRYFGSPCPVQHKKMFPRLRDEIERLRRGHRVNHDIKLYAELSRLKE